MLTPSVDVVDLLVEGKVTVAPRCELIVRRPNTRWRAVKLTYLEPCTAPLTSNHEVYRIVRISVR